MLKVKIIKLSSYRYKEYRDLRLTSLKNEPLAFGPSYEEEKDIKDKDWKKLLTKSCFLFAEVDGQLVGMGRVYFATFKKYKHIAKLSGVYIKKEYRGMGIAKLLVSELVKEAFSHKGTKKVKLTVSGAQKPAIALYKGLGFRKVGTMKKEFRISGKYYDAILMELTG